MALVEWGQSGFSAEAGFDRLRLLWLVRFPEAAIRPATHQRQAAGPADHITEVEAVGWVGSRGGSTKGETRCWMQAGVSRHCSSRPSPEQQRRGQPTGSRAVADTHRSAGVMNQSKAKFVGRTMPGKQTTVHSLLCSVCRSDQTMGQAGTGGSDKRVSRPVGVPSPGSRGSSAAAWESDGDDAAYTSVEAEASVWLPRARQIRAQRIQKTPASRHLGFPGSVAFSIGAGRGVCSGPWSTEPAVGRGTRERGP